MATKPDSPQSLAHSLYHTLQSYVHAALIYAAPLIPYQYQDQLKHLYQTRPYLTTFLFLQLALLALPLSILLTLLLALSFTLALLSLLTFLFWGGLLLLSSIPVLLFTLAVGTFIWGWGVAGYKLWVAAGLGRQIVMGGEGEKGAYEALREGVRERVAGVKQEVESEMEARFGVGREGVKYRYSLGGGEGREGVTRDAPLVVPSVEGQVGKVKEEREEVSLPALEMGKGGPGSEAGVSDHRPTVKEADFGTEDELYEPEEPSIVADGHGGDDVMRAISRSLS